MLEALIPAGSTSASAARRAPTGDRGGAAAHPRSGVADAFPRQLAELMAYFDGRVGTITRDPGPGDRPRRSGCSARAATARSSRHARPSVRVRPSLQLALHAARPGAVPVLVRRSRTAGRGTGRPAVRHGHRRGGRRGHRRGGGAARGSCRAVDAAAARRAAGAAGPPRRRRSRTRTPASRAAIEAFTGSHVVGGPDTMRKGLLDLLERTRPQELIDLHQRGRPGGAAPFSYEIVAGVLDDL